MRPPFRSFYARLSLVFLVLILSLGSGFIAITYRAARYLFEDVEQLLNREYARSIASELQPLVSEGFSRDRVRSAIHYMMVLNPKVEIYVLDSRGTIMAYFADPSQKVVRDRVDLAPLKRFIARGPRGLILGDDPRNFSRKKPFSAAPLRMGTEEGYIYIILGGERYDMSLRVIRESYLLKVMSASFILALTAALVVGLALFFLITRRLRALDDAVRSFRQGNFSSRVKIHGRDELADLGQTFNEMAESIETGVRQLQDSERERRELISNISHDLRSPLTSIHGYLETLLLKNGRLSPGERRRFLEISLQNTADLQRLVEELLELAKLEARQTRPAPEPVQMAELVQDIILKFRPLAERAGVVLSQEHPPDLPLVCADIALMERVLSNLLENAIRYTPSGGSVRVLCTPIDAAVRITVADTGTGIREKDLPHIFDRFYRGDEHRNRSRGGAGLGLAIARQIVELHGSSLGVESGPGEGSRFSFTLSTTPCSPRNDE